MGKDIKELKGAMEEEEERSLMHRIVSVPDWFCTRSLLYLIVTVHGVGGRTSWSSWEQQSYGGHVEGRDLELLLERTQSVPYTIVSVRDRHCTDIIVR